MIEGKFFMKIIVMIIIIGKEFEFNFIKTLYSIFEKIQNVLLYKLDIFIE